MRIFYDAAGASTFPQTAEGNVVLGPTERVIDDEKLANLRLVGLEEVIRGAAIDPFPTLQYFDEGDHSGNG